ncbi:hypothetical protein AAFF_G00226360 [Aldrovandia affinis]|uniref:Uncharacterized protein n=1 Tax=Aldrovandia affinis TaxID=143900 RepID=A0AAD7X2I0_9TELE|nr:hypothetical protein AAFF_G00226360 [Aldrovandia affinis]
MLSQSQADVAALPAHRPFPGRGLEDLASERSQQVAMVTERRPVRHIPRAAKINRSRDGCDGHECLQFDV